MSSIGNDRKVQEKIDQIYEKISKYLGIVDQILEIFDVNVSNLVPIKSLFFSTFSRIVRIIKGYYDV